MNQYLYDDSFEGLLTTIFYTYRIQEPLQITRFSQYLPNLLAEPISITTEEDKSDRVYNSLLTKLSASTLRKVYYLYLSELPEVDTLIYRYIKLCYQYGDSINLAKNNDVIIKVDTYCKRVTLESHRFKGFVRFKEVAAGIFYAKIEPDHFILPLLIEHFNQRFSDQYFIIHDLKREIAIVHTLDDIFLKPLTQKEKMIIEAQSCPDQFEQLFRSFYASTTISERKNKRQQLLYMPKRYHKHLIEL